MAGDPFRARAPLGPGLPDFYRLSALTGAAKPALDLGRMPVTVKILLENVLRHAGGGIVREADVAALAAWRPGAAAAPGATEVEIPFMPARVILQDFTGVPAVVDLAAMRDAMAGLGGDPPASTRSCPPIWSSTTPSRSIATAPPTPSPSTSSASTSATASAISCCAGPRPPSTTCASCRPAPASSTRSTSSTWRRSSTRRRDADGGGEIAFPDTLVGTAHAAT